MRHILSILVTAALFAGLTTLVAPNARAQSTDSGASAICQNDRSAGLDVVLVLDNSGSINDADTDPNRARFTGTDAFVTGLADLAASGRSVALNVVTFNTQATSNGWQTIDGSNADGLKQDVRDAWSDPTGETDHVAAFIFAQDQVGSRPDTNCRIVVMITDGVMDTGEGNGITDVQRALTQSKPFEPDIDTGETVNGPTVAERAASLGTSTFVLMLNPNPNTDSFEERLNATMTLFAAVTGDNSDPEVGHAYQIDHRSTIEDQSGQIISIQNVGLLLAHFYRVESEVGGGENVIDACPKPFDSGTQALPAGTLIHGMTIISFNGQPSDTDDIPEFLVEAGDDTWPITDVFDVASGNGVRWRLDNPNTERTPAAWRLVAPDTADYCVQLLARDGLQATLSADPNPVAVRDEGESKDLLIAYEPSEISGDVQFNGDVDGQQVSTSSDVLAINFSPTWAATGIPITATLQALDSDLFQTLPVDVATTSITVWDFSEANLPALDCAQDTVSVAAGEVPSSGQAGPVDTGCIAIPQPPANGLQPFVVLVSGVDSPGRSNIAFTLSPNEGAPPLIEGEPVAITENTSIWVAVDGLPNDRIEIRDTAVIAVAYGPSHDQTAVVSQESVEMTVDLAPRSNTLFAVTATILLTLVFGIVSMLLLWGFNRLTARLPNGARFYFEMLDSQTTAESEGGNGTGYDLQAATSTRNTLRFDVVEIRLEHPPVWKPLSDSIGVIHAPGPAVADPTGPALGTVPLGFSTLLIALRSPNGGTEYVAVVPRQGHLSGINGVGSISTDTVRRQRVAERLDRMDPPIHAESHPSSDDAPTGPSIERIPAGEPAEAKPAQTKQAEPNGPRLPGGPRLPSDR